MLDYNFGLASTATPNFVNEHTELFNSTSNNINSNLSNAISFGANGVYAGATSTAENPTSQNSQASTTDFKSHTNTLRYSAAPKGSLTLSGKVIPDLQQAHSSDLPHTEEDKAPRTFKFKDLKSPNLGFLSSEKNVRLIDTINPTKFNPSLSNSTNNLNDIVTNSINESITPNTYTLFSSSEND